MPDTTTSPKATRSAGDSARGLFASYRVENASLDEMLRANGPSHADWNLFSDSLQTLGVNAFDRRWNQARRTLSDQGVTYRVYGDHAVDGADHPWRLDPIPLIVGAGEWRKLQQGLAQRARLLNHILADLYGHQSLLRRGLLPVDLVYGSAAFLRPCAGLPVPEQVHLHVYAADMGRNAAGDWCIVGDRTQAPSGAGYALENRTIMASMLNESFVSCRVMRLAAFFRQFRQTLQALAPRRRDEPEIVLLTPGPANETYFEHVFLARYLGFRLVQGTDLMARDGHVYLKTLERPLPVDVILRRQDDAFCDNLELRRDSVIGVPGLLQAVRQGNVVIANALGSSWAETPALAECLPALCREIFGEDLLIPQVDSRWLGRRENLSYALDNLDDLVFKPTFGHSAEPPVFGRELSRQAASDFCDRLRDEPGNWVAQEHLPLSTMPNWIDGTMQPRRIGCRAFLTADGQGDYLGMDGGLTRVTSEADSYVVSMQSGGGSKDVWVIGETEPDPVSLLPAAGGDPPLKRSGFVLSSRVADDMYWLGRYVERGEFLARILRWVYTRIESEQGSGVPDLKHLIRYLSTLEYLSSDAPLGSVEDVETTLSEILSGNDPGKLRGILLGARGIANRLRDRISMDAWRLTRLLGTEGLVPAENGHMRTADALETLNGLLHTTAAFSGIVSENMIRDPGWTFLDTGRRLERAFQSMTLLQSCLVTVSEADLAGVLNAILEIHDSGMTYRTRYLHTVRFAPALDLVLTDETNPRSVAYQLAAIERYTQQLPTDPRLALRPLHQRLAIEQLTRVRMIDPAALGRTVGSRRRRVELDRTLAELRGGITALSDALVQRYFSYAIASRQLA